MKLQVIALSVLLPALAAAPDIVRGNAFGNPRAPIQVELFSDFQCPHCKRMHDEELPLLMRDFVNPGKVYLVERYFPLPGHTYGRLSAEFVCAAAQFGKYKEAADILFARQAQWSGDGKIEQTIDEVLNPEERRRVGTVIREEAVRSQIDHDLDIGHAVPVMQTPTLLVTHGVRRYPLSGEGAANYSLLKSFLDELVSKTHSN